MNPAALYCWTHTQQSQSPTVLLLLKPQPSVLNPTKFDNSSTSYMLRICVCTSPLSVLNGETNRKDRFEILSGFSPFAASVTLHYCTKQNSASARPILSPQYDLFFPLHFLFLLFSCLQIFAAAPPAVHFFFIPNGQVLFSSSDSRFYSNKTLCKCWVVSCNSGESRLFARLVTEL